MNKQVLMKALEYTEEKHRHDIVNTFDTDISMMCVDVLSVLKNCIEIPNNATNGDMIKAIFPNADTFIEEDCPHIVNISLGYFVQAFQDSWWNAPYRRETE